MGGEKPEWAPITFLMLGSPPHGRGKVRASRLAVGDGGITPAWAGKRQFYSPLPCLRRDHPRVGGEKVMMPASMAFITGSPPRGRRNAVLVHPYHHRPGITPARAGKRCERQAHTYTARDHPRMGGEKFAEDRGSNFVSGSPPRGRGKVHSVFKVRKHHRITPA